MCMNIIYIYIYCMYVYVYCAIVNDDISLYCHGFHDKWITGCLIRQFREPGLSFFDICNLQVYDDATDWYSEAANPWLSEKQREEASNSRDSPEISSKPWMTQDT